MDTIFNNFLIKKQYNFALKQWKDFKNDIEFELIKNDDIEVVAEYTYIVSAEWLTKLYREHLIYMFDLQEVDFDEFLDTYDPEVEGTAIYFLANQAEEIIEDENI